MQNDEQETAGILHEQFETIIKAHTDVVDDFKDEINRQKAMETLEKVGKKPQLTAKVESDIIEKKPHEFSEQAKKNYRKMRSTENQTQ